MLLREDMEKFKRDVWKAMQHTQEAQLFYKTFLNPVEIALKTEATQLGFNQIQSMPCGLQQVLKFDIADNKYLFADFEPFKQAYYKMLNNLTQLTFTQSLRAQQLDLPYKFQKIKQLRCDNMISLMKPETSRSQGLKVAICVCINNQSKSTLKKTLTGIRQNIQAFERRGVSCDQIAVVVVLDGIDKVHPSIEQLFQELQKESDIYFDEKVRQLDLKELINQARQYDDDEDSENLNHIVFAEEQFNDMKKKRFGERIREYRRCQELLRDIEELEKRKYYFYEDLDDTVKKFYQDFAKEQWKNLYGDTDDDINFGNKKDLILQFYTQNAQASPALVKKALNEAKKYCKEYFETRQDLALLYPFRIRLNEEKQRNQEDLNEAPPKIFMNTFFLTKYQSKGKISSHNWFFNGFCTELKSQFAILVDAGVVPEKQSIWKMCDHMQRNNEIGGVCGYLSLRPQKLSDDQQIDGDSIDCVSSLCLKFVDIQRAQQFEYHIEHLFNKPFESSELFKYIHVLPEAFSGYRMSALRISAEARYQLKTLPQYFRSVQSSNKDIEYRCYPFSATQVFCKVVFPDPIYSGLYNRPAQDSYQKILRDKNIYRAGERILPLGIYQNGYNLAYLPDAHAEMAPVKTLQSLMEQRKRWINGGQYAFRNVRDIMSQGRWNFFLFFQIQFLTLLNILRFFSPTLFMYLIHVSILTFHQKIIIPILISTKTITSTSQMHDPILGILTYLIDFIFFLTFFALIFYSLNTDSSNCNQKFRSFFYGVSTVFGMFCLVIAGILLYDVVTWSMSQYSPIIYGVGREQTIPSDIFRYLFFIMILLYLMPLICNPTKITQVLLSTFSYLFFIPTYLIIFPIYSMCHLDNISFSLKTLSLPIPQPKLQQAVLQWRAIKIMEVAKFVLWNVVGMGVLLGLEGLWEKEVVFWVGFGVVGVVDLVLFVVVLVGGLYNLYYNCKQCQLQTQPTAYHNHSQTPSKISQIFTQTKPSLHSQITNRIHQTYQNLQQAELDAPLSYRILSSKIYNRLKPISIRNRNRDGYSRRMENMRDGLSRIQIGNQDRMRRQLSRISELRQQNQHPNNQNSITQPGLKLKPKHKQQSRHEQEQELKEEDNHKDNHRINMNNSLTNILSKSSKQSNRSQNQLVSKEDGERQQQ